MTTELEVHHDQGSTLHAQMEYARAIAVAHMLPDNYRNKPADIMLAMGLGQSMGLSPAESLYRISVVKGKPTASAELIAANVRKAGHRLRVTGDDTSATCIIIRADDPDFEFTVVRDAAWAQAMGLSDQPNYRKQGDTMLSWRAITAAARLACTNEVPTKAENPVPNSVSASPVTLASVVVALETSAVRRSVVTRVSILRSNQAVPSHQ